MTMEFDAAARPRRVLQTDRTLQTSRALQTGRTLQTSRALRTGPARRPAAPELAPAARGLPVARPPMTQPPRAATRRPAAPKRRARRRRQAAARRRLAVLLLFAAALSGLLALRGLAPGLPGLPGLQEALAGPINALRGLVGLGPEVPENIAPDGTITLQLQQPGLPNGCEAASAAMLLGWAGAPVPMEELFYDYFPRRGFSYMGGDRFGPDPEECYVGDAGSETGGWYCFEGPAAAGMNAFLDEMGSPRTALALRGMSQEQLAGYLDAGIPLAAWVTQEYRAPETSSFTWVLPDGSRCTPYGNLHCVVLAGREPDGSYRVADPLRGWQTVDPAVFWQSFEAMGGRAVAVA